MSSLRLSYIDKVMEEEVNQGRISGINTLIARGGEVVYSKQFGLMNRETGHKMREDTLFRIYSMTKPIVCTAFMTLYEQGKFDLKEPVAKYIPAFAQLKVLQRDALGNEKLVNLEQPVSIHHLLTHTSGLVYDFYDESPVCNLYRRQHLLGKASRSLKELVDHLCQLPLANQPGSRWFYSISIDVIAYLIEIISGKSLSDFLAEVLFEPLGMRDTGFFVKEADRERVASMYGGVDLGGENISWKTLLDVWTRGVNQPLDVTASSPIDNPSFARGGHGLISTAQDYWQFTQMLLNKGELNGARVLNPQTIAFMYSNHLKPTLLPIKFENIEISGYGFGLGSRVLVNVPQAQMLSSEGEYGWSGAAKTYYWIDPQQDLIGIFLAQYMCNFSMIERIFQNLTYHALTNM